MAGTHFKIWASHVAVFPLVASTTDFNMIVCTLYSTLSILCKYHCVFCFHVILALLQSISLL